MLRENLVLLGILILGVAFSNRLVATGAAVLLGIQMMKIHSLLSVLERRSLDAGLTLLIIAVLVPFATGKARSEDILRAFTTIPGILAIVGGALQAYISGQGVELLKVQPEVIVGLLVGTIIGVCFMKGIPVGPLAAAGLTAIALRFIQH